MTGAAQHADPSPGSPLFGEHVSRYRLVSSLLAGRRVLDVSCGGGLGLPYLLAEGARQVVGADLDADALASARRRVPAAPVVRADGLALPFRSAAFDVVTSFETVEHLDEAQAFVEEIARVTKADGVAYISTPNAHFSAPTDGTPVNPFHVREWFPAEFRRLCESAFAQVELLGQTTSTAHGPCPFWTRRDRWPTSGWLGVTFLLWRVCHRLPAALGQVLYTAVRGRPLYPEAEDFTFRAAPDVLAEAHGLVAVCRGPRSA